MSEVQSRREFFRSAKRIILPILGSVIVFNHPLWVKAMITECQCTSCVGSCMGGCKDLCMGTCTGTCCNTCRGTCISCSGTCKGTCLNSCVSSSVSVVKESMKTI